MTCAQPGCGSEMQHVHCVSCGAANPAAIICPHHTSSTDEWAAENRYWCDGLHRRQWGPRLPVADREAVVEYAE